MNKKFSESDIWTHIASKDFSQLSKAEKATVLKHLTKEEYEQMRLVSMQAKNHLSHDLKELKLRPEMAKSIFEQGKRKRKGLLKRLAYYQVPAWQAVAAAVFLAMTFYSLGNSPSNFQQSVSKDENSTDSLMGISLAEDSSLSRFLIESL